MDLVLGHQTAHDWTCFLALGAVSVFLAAVVGRASEYDEFGAEQIQALREKAMLACAVYDLSKSELSDGWRQIAKKWDKDGFQAAVYERTLSNGQKDLKVVFAGTNDRHDMATDVNAGSFISADWAFGPVRELAEQQFVRAQAYAAGFVHMAKNDSSIRSIELLGHSLGGELAQFTAAKLDVQATVFNSASMVIMAEKMTTRDMETANRRVTQYVNSEDRVFPITSALPMARQFGHIYQIEATGQLKRKSLVDRTSEGHSMEAIMDSLSVNHPEISQRIPVSHEALEIIARDLTVIGKGLEELSRLSAIKSTFDTSGKGIPGAFERVTGRVGRELSSIGAITEIGEYRQGDSRRSG